MRHLLPIAVILYLTLPSLVAQCPTISLIGPAGITSPGDIATIRAELRGQTPSSLRYLWSVKGGKILSRGDSAEIDVTVPESMVTSIRVSVSIDGLPAGCATSASDTFPFAPVGVDPVLIDEFGELKPNEVRARLDTFFDELKNNPKQIGVVVLHLGRNERMDSNNDRLQFIFSHVKYRKFESSRIWFQLDRSKPGRTSTRLYRYAQDVADVLFEIGDSNEQLIIKGRELH